MFFRYSRFILAGIIILSVSGIFALKNLKFDFEIEKYFPFGDEDLAYYNNFNQKFNAGKRDEYIFIALSNNNGLFRKDFLEKIGELTTFLKQNRQIAEVYSIANLTTVSIINGMVYQDSLVHISDTAYYTYDSLNLFKSEEYRSLNVSKNGKHIMVSAFTVKHLSYDEKENLIAGIKQEIARLNFDDVHCAAKIIVEKTYVDELRKNFLIYIVAALLIIAISLYLIFRSFLDIIIPFLSIIISVLLTLALISITGFTLDSVSSLLPSILSIICMSNVIHISIKYKEELTKGFGREEALTRTFKDIGLATFFTSFTTSIGFFTLCITTVIPILVFGLFTGLGILIAYLISVAFIFSVYSLTPVPRNIKEDPHHGKWSELVAWIFRMDIKHRKPILAGIVVFGIISFFYLTKVEINSSLLMNLPEKNPILNDYRFFESEFGGTRVFEVGFDMEGSGNSFYSIKSTGDLHEFENFLKDSCGVRLIISPAMFLKTANKILSKGAISRFVLPATQENQNICLKYISQSDWGPEIFSYVSEDGQHARISGKIPDLTIKEFKELEKKIERYFQSRNKDFDFNYKLTGSSVLLDKVTFLIFENLLYGLVIGICIMALIAGIMMRSVSMGLLLLIPNIIPVVVMGAVMGLFNIYLKADTSIIFTIAFGIGVDNTIHLMSKYIIERDKGSSPFYAMKRSFLTRGKAMIISSSILTAGFMTLLFSSFKGTYYVGLLIAVSMIFALLFDLTLTPLMIMLFAKDRKKTGVPKKNIQAS